MFLSPSEEDLTNEDFQLTEENITAGGNSHIQNSKIAINESSELRSELLLCDSEHPNNRSNPATNC
jgi:hypothetical protein